MEPKAYHSAAGALSALFDMPVIKIESCFSQFEPMFKEGIDMSLLDNIVGNFSLYQKQEPGLQHSQQPKKKRKIRMDNDNTYDESMNVKRGWELMSPLKNSKEANVNSCDDEYENLEKKVKKEAIFLNPDEALVSDTSTIYASSPIPKDVSSPIEASDKETANWRHHRITSKNCRIKKALVNKESLLFHVEEDSNKNAEVYKTLSREQILEQDPMLLVYFYEKNLKFKKSTNFSAEDLKKL